MNYYEDDDFRPVVAPRNTYVPARSYQDISLNEQTLMGQVVNAAGTVMTHRQMAHLSRSDETPLINAAASILYSIVYSIAGAVITGAILFVAWNVIGGDGGFYALAWVFAWGVCFLVALYFNRQQGLWFSPAGLDHHEIRSRERIALYVIDRHVELLEKRWGLHESTTTNPVPTNRVIQGQSRSHPAQKAARRE